MNIHEHYSRSLHYSNIPLWQSASLCWLCPLNGHQKWPEKDIWVAGAGRRTLVPARHEDSAPSTHNMIQLLVTSASRWKNALSVFSTCYIQSKSTFPSSSLFPHQNLHHALSPTISHPILPLPDVQVATHATHCRPRRGPKPGPDSGS